jgi:hypothetical protein
LKPKTGEGNMSKPFLFSFSVEMNTKKKIPGKLCASRRGKTERESVERLD